MNHNICISSRMSPCELYGPVTRAYFSTYNSTYEQFFKHVKVVIYKFCIRSKYARIRFDNVSYGEAARGVVSAQNFPTYESV